MATYLLQGGSSANVQLSYKHICLLLANLVHHNLQKKLGWGASSRGCLSWILPCTCCYFED